MWSILRWFLDWRLESVNPQSAFQTSNSLLIWSFYTCNNPCPRTHPSFGRPLLVPHWIISATICMLGVSISSSILTTLMVPWNESRCCSPQGTCVDSSCLLRDLRGCSFPSRIPVSDGIETGFWEWIESPKHNDCSGLCISIFRWTFVFFHGWVLPYSWIGASNLSGLYTLQTE